MKVNKIYSTFNGEQNRYGIGSLTLFLRLQGCHLRCYLPTLGMLCDTPEGLSAEGGEDLTALQVVDRLAAMRIEAGTNLVCLTGGDPLWRKPGELHELFRELHRASFLVTVETSGTLDWRRYLEYPNVSFVLDYKLQSAGVKGNLVLEHAHTLRIYDFIKFVVYDEADYLEMLQVLPELFTKSEAQLTAGVFWGGPLSTFQLYDKLRKDGYLWYLKGGINMQTHKLAEWAALHPAPAVTRFDPER